MFANNWAKSGPLIMNNGSDGAVTSIWPPVAAGGVARDCNVLIFDGPGQQSMLFERRLPFWHDWEQVITPVVDFLLGRSDVDPQQIVLYGIGQAGYWVPRALAFEHRIAAAIADPGAYDVFEPWAKPRLLSCGSCSSRDQLEMITELLATNRAQLQSLSALRERFGEARGARAES
jgi:hypothetical protein